MSVSTPLGDFGAPPDATAWVALLLASALFAANRTGLAARAALVSERTWVLSLALFAAAVSSVYVVVYLRGGPRIIDATTYYLQARALSEGHVAFDVPFPTASFRGRFLLASVDGHSLSGIFPPGYPALLALGFLVGAPLLVGPLVAALLVVVTYALSRRLFADRAQALLAAALSATCGVLRYHTADTMSHGLSALLFALALYFTLGRSRGASLAAGICLGWLVATRPVTGAAASVVCAVALVRQPRAVAFLVAGALVPVSLFLVEQRVATSSWLTSSQAAYYALADGPPGCFRYGFGHGIGCVSEHGDFVRAHLRDGYGFVAAAGTTLRRLKMHLADAANAELFVPVLLYGLAVAWRESRARLAVLAVLAVVVAYVPFYFDGNYPGGGARFYADVLPFEHVLLALALSELRLARIAVPVALAGFALHTAYDHRRLAEREGGRPMFEEAVVRRAGVKRGLVFVDTDHGFDLGFDPGVTSAAEGVVVARARHDAHDALLWARLGRPSAYEYAFTLAPNAPRPALTPRTFEPNTTHAVQRFEAESEWPPLVVDGGDVTPSFPLCASAHRALALNPSPGRALRVRLDLRGMKPGKYRIDTGWVTSASDLRALLVTSTGIRWNITSRGSMGSCVAPEGPIFVGPQPIEFVDVYVSSGATFDYLDMVPTDPLPRTD